MARPKLLRKMDIPPIFGGFRPIGQKGRPINEIYLELDEYESIKLCDYDGLSQSDAAALMKISRPTLTRIYQSARKKISIAFVEGRGIVIKGGNIDFDENWFRCNDCQTVFNDVSFGENLKCPRCASTNSKNIIDKSDLNQNQQVLIQKQPTISFYHCKKCDIKISHRNDALGIPLYCPSCGEVYSSEAGLKSEENKKVLKWIIPSLGKDLSSTYNTRFSKSPYFLILSPDKIEIIENPFVDFERNVGLKIFELIEQRGIQGIVAGYLGEKVLKLVLEKNIRFESINQKNTVEEIVNFIKSRYFEAQ